ncbi:hypothetical protein MVEN_00512500 [Mycena venus]|uniref:Uncharacterized protein n=1 Tax=Mycena venus TaxID=2733690 RepID=A0A8H7D510_9AGAR|nr:hypothetical protein MVEN_00512500 [Mycena venus]
MQDLPQEIIDRIVDHLALEITDKHSEEVYSDWKDHFHEGDGLEFTSVANCGLISRAWVPRSRFYLFANTNLSNDFESGADNINSFLRLVATSPLPLSFIQSLDLDLLGGPLNDKDMRRLLNLPMLTSLRIRTPDDASSGLEEFYPDIKPHIPSLLVTNSPLLSGIHLDLNTDLPLTFFVHFVTNLPLLKYLTVGRTNGESFDIVNPDSETVPPSGSFPQDLLVFDVNLSCGAGLLFAWLLSLPELPIPRSLALSLQPKDRDFPIEASLQPIEEYLRRAGSELESLSLSFSRTFLATLVTDESDYPLCTLTFAPSQGALAVPEILSLLPSSRLSTLTIVLEEDENVPWEAMDHALSHRKFEPLERFALEDSRAVLKAEVSLLNEEARAGHASRQRGRRSIFPIRCGMTLCPSKHWNCEGLARSRESWVP